MIGPGQGWCSVCFSSFVFLGFGCLALRISCTTSRGKNCLPGIFSLHIEPLLVRQSLLLTQGKRPRVDRKGGREALCIIIREPRVSGVRTPKTQDSILNSRGYRYSEKTFGELQRVVYRWHLIQSHPDVFVTSGVRWSESRYS